MFGIVRILVAATVDAAGLRGPGGRPTEGEENSLRLRERTVGLIATRRNILEPAVAGCNQKKRRPGLIPFSSILGFAGECGDPGRL